MGDVVNLVRPLDESNLVAALREITDDTTTAIVIVTSSPTRIGVRTFGPSGECRAALRAVIEQPK